MFQTLKYSSTINFSTSVPTPGGEQAETALWVAAVVAAGGSVSAGRRTTVNTLITSLKNGGWTKYDRIWLLAGEASIASRVDIKGLVLATIVGSPTFQADRGWTGVESSGTDYLQSGFNPTVGTNNYLQNNAHLSAWMVATSLSTAGAAGFLLGHGDSGNPESTVIIRDDSCGFRINTTNFTLGVNAANTAGLWHGNRNSSTNQELFQNGVSNVADNATVTSALRNSTMRILAIENSGSGSGGTQDQLALATIGGSLTGTEITNDYNAFRAYMTAVGVP